jgi:hypothetical protein
MFLRSKLTLLAAAIVLSAQAYAGTTVSHSPTPGAAITFTNTAPAPATETFGIATFSGGAFLEPSSNNYGGTSAAPPGSGIYWSVGVSGANGNVDTGTATFSEGLSQIGFEWGSPDAYNTITFYGAGGVNLGSFTGAYVESNAPPPPFNLGDQSVTEYFTFSSNSPIYSASYTSTTNAFETANYTYVAAVPEASDFVFFATGVLGVIAIVSRRKRLNASQTLSSSMACA